MSEMCAQLTRERALEILVGIARVEIQSRGWACASVADRDGQEKRYARSTRGNQSSLENVWLQTDRGRNLVGDCGARVVIFTVSEY
jgi:hypothetical protein